jgi:hypothetical protein
MPYLTKTQYLMYLDCPKNAWLALHKPELKAQFVLSQFEQNLVANGNLVESWARLMFPGGVLIEATGQAAAEATQAELAKRTPYILQATFLVGDYLVRNDVLAYEAASDSYQLYEIKATNSLKDSESKANHIDDATFQYLVLEQAGIKVNRVNLMHLNPEYVRGDEINPVELFKIDDITEQVGAYIDKTKIEMAKAATALLHSEERALDCPCLYKSRINHCSTFAYNHPEVPAYAVHDLSRIGLNKKVLASLVDSGILAIEDIPETTKLSTIQRNQAIVQKSQRPIIDLPAIQQELSALSYPIYFLDYETYPSSIPLFKGYKPYQQVPFQFSLHVLNSAEGDLEHHEFLHLEASDPEPALLSAMQASIGPEGSIVVWHKPFEKSRNNEMAQRHPEHQLFLADVNNRIYDLKDIFQKQLHVHHGFKGRASIKKVLPVLVPELSYQTLDIKEGGEAMQAWYEQIYMAPDEVAKQTAAEQLLKYCYLDTYAMYAIWRELVKLQ